MLPARKLDQLLCGGWSLCGGDGVLCMQMGVNQAFNLFHVVFETTGTVEGLATF